MPIMRYLLIVSAVLGLIGVAIAILLDERRLGMAVFVSGFMLGAACAVAILLKSESGALGRLELGIKVSASGFGLGLLGQLINFVMGADGSIGNFFFLLGLAVMIVGVAVAVVRMAKF